MLWLKFLPNPNGKTITENFNPLMPSNSLTKTQIDSVLNALFQDAKRDSLRIFKRAAKSVLGEFKPGNFKDVYLSISQEQGEELQELIEQYGLKNMVEFGTSFGISTLFLAKGALTTGGSIITTELLESKARKAKDNFQRAGVEDLIDVRVGDAMDTLKGHAEPIDLLLLDGWKDLYYPLFKMLEPNFHQGTFIYVDNADMNETRLFLSKIEATKEYQLQTRHGHKVVLIQPVKKGLSAA